MSYELRVNRQEYSQLATHDSKLSMKNSRSQSQKYHLVNLKNHFGSLINRRGSNLNAQRKSAFWTALTWLSFSAFLFPQWGQETYSNPPLAGGLHKCALKTSFQSALRGGKGSHGSQLCGFIPTGKNFLVMGLWGRRYRRK